MSNNEPLHQPVLVDDVLTVLDPSPDSVILDCTFGSGGHAEVLMNQLASDGMYVAMDWDANSIDFSTVQPDEARCEFVFRQGNFARAREVVQDVTSEGVVDAVLADLGWSTDQLRKGGKGLTFEQDEFLDMRYNPDATQTAADLLHNATEERLTELFRQHGEHKHGRTIARKIVENRDEQPFRRTLELMDVITSVVGGHEKKKSAARIFQALRTEVNHELDNLDRFLEQLPLLLSAGGRACVISFHSLEDRRVKESFRSGVESGMYQKLTEGPIQPDEEERKQNPAARSARLRAVERRRA